MDRMSKETKESFLRFLSNGMDISEFGFRYDYDKENFFKMYEDILLYQNEKTGDELYTVYYDSNGDLTIFKEAMEIAHFLISDDYQTLKCHTPMTWDDVDLLFCCQMMFYTIKKLKEMIDSLSAMISEKSSPSVSTRYKSNLDSKTLDIVERISRLQKKIMKENAKYRTIKKGESE